MSEILPPLVPIIPEKKWILANRDHWVFRFNWAGVYVLQQHSEHLHPIDKLKEDLNNITPEVVWDWAWAFSYENRAKKYSALTYVDFLAFLPVGEQFLEFRDSMVDGIMQILPRKKNELVTPINTQLLNENSTGTNELEPQQESLAFQLANSSLKPTQNPIPA